MIGWGNPLVVGACSSVGAGIGWMKWVHSMIFLTVGKINTGTVLSAEKILSGLKCSIYFSVDQTVYSDYKHARNGGVNLEVGGTKIERFF